MPKNKVRVAVVSGRTGLIGSASAALIRPLYFMYLHY